jgi:hypothetical protein
MLDQKAKIERLRVAVPSLSFVLFSWSRCHQEDVAATVHLCRAACFLNLGRAG